jgi:hypothetical protein
MADDRAQARREAAILLGVDIEHLSAADSLRVDMVSALRLVIDHEQATVLDGREADLGKLNVAVQSLIALLPNRELPAPASSRPDPRTIMWETYLGMRRRGEAADLASTFEGRGRRIAELEAEVAALKAGVPAPDESTSAPLPDNVVTLPRATADKQPPKPAPPQPAAATSAPVQGELVMVVDQSPAEPWREYVEPDGSIRTTPRGPGKYWGPV